MSLVLAEPTRTSSFPGVSDEQLTLLACTFEDAAQPVWIHDLRDRCLYSNASAVGRHPGPEALRFNMLDHRGATLARVITLPAA